MDQYRQLGVAAILGKKKGSVLVGVVDCAAFACYSVVQGEAVHGEVVCVASPVLEDHPALDNFVDAAADGALVHLTHLAGGLAIRQEAVPYFSPILSCFKVDLIVILCVTLLLMHKKSCPEFEQDSVVYFELRSS